ncbi:MAG: hypothetical protein EOP61_39310, partial [Sphingomonadales bacterium]
GVPGVPPANVVILGGGVAGVHAAEMANGARDAAAEDDDIGRGHARHAAEQQPTAALGLHQRIGANIDRHAACDLAHRLKQRQAPGLVRHGLVGDAGGAGFHQRFGLRLVCGEVEIGEERMVRLEHRALDGLGLFDLHDHFGGGEDVGGAVDTVYATQAAIDRAVVEADLVIGAVLIPGAAAPKLITRNHLKKMKLGAVLVDISIDQGGCFETSRPTTHDDPIYEVDGILHYCVANMPGAVPRTSTYALNNVTLPFALDLANKGTKAALKADPHLAEGLNVADGKVAHAAVAHDLDLPFAKPGWL